jgi:O-acetyl-ADP-ribose deacetylase (regulator of RNase III)
MARPGATPSDWKTHPMRRPDRARVIPRVFGHDAMERLRAGLVPEEMEDKWFVVFADDELRLYRSWTGLHVFTVRFEPAPWGERVAELIVETAASAEDDAAPASDASTASSAHSDDALERACERLYWVLDVVVLGRPLRDLPPARGRTPEILLERMDITTVTDDVIVNAANESLLGGGGVDGAIHRAAGRELLLACKSLPEVRPKVRCPTGEARITPAFGRLRARWIVHAVGPRYRGDGQDARLLGSAIRASLTLAEQYGARSVALPAISCGVFAYPLDAAAKVAIGVVHERPWRLDTVRFALWKKSEALVSA